MTKTTTTNSQGQPAAEQGTSATQRQAVRQFTYSSRAGSRPIEVSDPALADSLNKRTHGTRILSDVYDLLRIKKQNDSNRRLVRGAQDRLEKFAGGNEGTDAMTEEPDDVVNIGDTNYNVKVGDPDQLDEVMRQLQQLKDGQQQPKPEPTEPEPTTPGGGATIITPPGTPVTVGPGNQVTPGEPVQPVSPATPEPDPRIDLLIDAVKDLQDRPAQPAQPVSPAEPRPVSPQQPKSIWPAVGLATALALGAGGVAGWMAGGRGGAEDTDTNTRYLLTFDPETGESTPPVSTIPTPTLE